MDNDNPEKQVAQDVQSPQSPIPLTTQVNIIPGAIKTRHLAKTTTVSNGDLYYGDGNGNFTRLAPGSAGQILQTNGAAAPSWVTLSDTDAFQPIVIAPSSITVNDAGAGVTTSGTTELTIISKTITNPSQAGQMLLLANFDMVSPTVANDIFACRIYNPAGSAIYETLRAFESTNAAATVTMSAVCAVAASGTQTIKMTVQRDTGTGTITMQNNRNALSWVIFPGASSVA